MHIEILDGHSSLSDLEPTWREIENRNDSLSVFQSWHWNSLWARVVLPRLPGAAAKFYVVLDDTGRAVAILPCFSRPLFGGSVMLIQLVGHRMSFLNDIVSAYPHDLATARDIVVHLRRSLGVRELVHLRHLHGASKFAQALEQLGFAESQCRRLVVRRSDPSGDILGRLSTNKRRDLRWKENKLRKQHGMSLRVLTPVEAATGFDRFIRLHHARFESRQRSTVLRNANVDFLRAVFAHLQDRGKAELLELGSPEATAAIMFGIIDKGSYYFINSGFDGSYAQYSPVKLLLTMAMRRAFNELDCDHFELGPDYDDYKLDWRPEQEESYTACIGGTGAYSRIAAAGYRAAFRRAIKRPSRSDGSR